VSPAAAQAMREALDASGCSWYADPENHDLRTALAQKHNVDIECICVDAGIDSLLGLTVRMLMESGQSVVTSEGAYPTFNYHVSGFGGKLHMVPYKDNHENPQALIKAAETQKASLLYFSNPDNPMGTWHSSSVVQQTIDAVPAGCTLLLDEAYIEFANADAAPAIDVSNEQVIRFRTFSKAYGMAGMRIGYAIAHPDIITGYNKIRNHFGINRLAQIGALASLQDSTFLPRVLEQVAVGRERVYQFADKHGLGYLPSATNFVAVDMGSSERATSMLAELNDNGVFIRMPSVSPLNRFIRVGIGTPQEHAVFITQFDKLYGKVEPA